MTKAQEGPGAVEAHLAAAVELIDTQEAAHAAVELLCEKLGVWPDSHVRRCTCNVSHADDCALRAEEGLGWYRAGRSLHEARSMMEMIGGLPVYVRAAYDERTFNLGPRASERVETQDDFDRIVRAALQNSPTGEVGIARVSL